jgi:hypothetical protein
MIEVALLFCFIAVLSPVIGAIRGIAMLLGIARKQIRRAPWIFFASLAPLRENALRYPRHDVR